MTWSRHSKWLHHLLLDIWEDISLDSTPLILPQFSSGAQSCPTLGNPVDCSTPGIPVHHQLPELPQIHVYQVGDAIQSAHPLSSPSPPAFNFSQHQGESVFQ